MGTTGNIMFQSGGQYATELGAIVVYSRPSLIAARSVPRTRDGIRGTQVDHLTAPRPANRPTSSSARGHDLCPKTAVQLHPAAMDE